MARVVRLAAVSAAGLVLLLSFTIIAPTPAGAAKLVARSNTTKRLRSMSRMKQPMEAVAPAGPLELTDCACSCCQITSRKPQEIVDPRITLKCMLNEVSPRGCPATCTVKHNPVLRTEIPSEIENGLDYNRFCFFQCQPKTDKLSGPCGPIHSEKDEKKAMAKDGNGADANLPPYMPNIGAQPSDFVAPGTKSGKGMECKKEPCQYKEILKARNEAREVYHQAMADSAEARALAKKAPPV